MALCRLLLNESATYWWGRLRWTETCESWKRVENVVEISDWRSRVEVVIGRSHHRCSLSHHRRTTTTQWTPLKQVCP